MNLETKLKKQLKNFSLKSPDPKQNHPWHLDHLHADFIELKTLLWDRDSYLTLQDVITHYKDFDYEIDFEESHYIEDQYSSSSSEKNDRWNSKFVGIFEVIEERYLAYDDAYPFEINGLKIKLKNDLSEIHKLYLYLLISSNLNNFGHLKDILTSEFENLSTEALRILMPKMNVEEFGQNSNFHGNTKSKIEALARKMGLSTRGDYLRNIPAQANKEKGLDLVGWLGFQDKIANMIILLGQCACGKDWTKKKGETKLYEDSYLDFNRVKPIHAMFIPYGLVKYTDGFYQADFTNGNLLFERKRILELSAEKIAVFTTLRSYEIVERLINFEAVEV